MKRFLSLLFVGGVLIRGAGLAGDIIEYDNQVLNFPSRPEKKDATSPSNAASQIHDSNELNNNPSHTSINKESKREKKESSKNEPIHFQSKTVTANKTEGIINLIDNVVVNQGDMELKADSATIFRDENSQDIDRVDAKGHVKFYKIDEKSGLPITAEGDSGIYSAKSQVMVLDGNAFMAKGSDTIKGKFIEYNITDGSIRGGGVKGVVTAPGKHE